MNTIILAAGLGSRFKDITQSTHKALLDIHGTHGHSLFYVKQISTILSLLQGIYTNNSSI